ncbi:MAG: hypothetical protein CBC42_01130 [Betaproteobacteria bacterium TMED82]|nr:MAG: hypothetical protein CBC42_01130 [Betaproteobacteria bacterium TMED82]|tara:strand:- start:35762 stop:36160 length:399 start_codon:yes stop_codon:yes gene_type:complete
MVEESTKLDTRLIMAASLIYMSSIDGTIAQQEWGQLKTVVGGDDELLETALDFVRDTPLDIFLKQAPSLLNDDQKLCVLLNTYDSLLSDGTSEPEELELFDKFLEAFNVKKEDISSHMEVIFIKNNTKLLGI